VENFLPCLGWTDAVELYIYLSEREGELPGGPSRLLAQLRRFLYDRLSIEEMEDPSGLLARMKAEERR
jgi:hypothetical protein